MNDVNKMAVNNPIPADRLIMLLSILFVVQMAAGTILRFAETRYQPIEASMPMLTCNFSKITKVIIEENDPKNKTRLVLQKEKDGWKLPEQDKFPAAPSAVTELLDSLKALKKGFPVTSTADAADRFKVGSNNFLKAVHLYDDQQKESILYLGSSPTFHVVYARTPESNDIYTVELSDYQVSAQAANWVDRTAAQVKPADIVAMDMQNFQVRKDQGKWILSTEAKDSSLHDSVANNLVDAVANLTITSVLGTKKQTVDDTMPLLTFNVKLKNGSTITYTFSKAKDRNSLVLKLSDQPWFMTVDDWTVNRIKKITPASLLESEAKESAREQAQKANKERQTAPAELKR